MKTKSKSSFATRLGYHAVYGLCWLTGLLPHWFLYGAVVRVVHFLLYRIVRYRLGVVRQNLAGAFPEKSVPELRAIERKFYRNLSEYFIDAVDLASITRQGLLKRVVWPAENRAELNRTSDGRNWITLLSHYGSWELMSTYGLYPDGPVMVSVYRPLRSRVFDMYYHRVRNRMDRINSIPMNDLLRFYMAHRDGIDGFPLSVALIADQSPPIDAQSRWVEFFHQPTVFFHGGEKIARKFGLPVYYMRVRKIGRGRYEQTFELIWDGVSPTEDYAITGEYARRLEEDIRRSPEIWLWSHRRWKRRPDREAMRAYNEKYGTDIPE